MKHNKIQQLIDLLSNLDIKHTDKTAVAGFDGFIDIITRPIACGTAKHQKVL